MENMNSPPAQLEIKLAAIIDSAFAERSRIKMGRPGSYAARNQEDFLSRQAREILGFNISEDYLFPEGRKYHEFEISFCSRFKVQNIMRDLSERDIQDIRKNYEEMKALNPERFAMIPDPGNNYQNIYDILLGCASKINPADIRAFITNNNTVWISFSKDMRASWHPCIKTALHLKNGLKKINHPLASEMQIRGNKEHMIPEEIQEKGWGKEQLKPMKSGILSTTVEIVKNFIRVNPKNYEQEIIALTTIKKQY